MTSKTPLPLLELPKDLATRSALCQLLLCEETDARNSGLPELRDYYKSAFDTADRLRTALANYVSRDHPHRVKPQYHAPLLKLLLSGEAARMLAGVRSVAVDNLRLAPARGALYQRETLLCVFTGLNFQQIRETERLTGPHNFILEDSLLRVLLNGELYELAQDALSVDARAAIAQRALSLALRTPNLQTPAWLKRSGELLELDLEEALFLRVSVRLIEHFVLSGIEPKAAGMPTLQVLYAPTLEGVARLHDGDLRGALVHFEAAQKDYQNLVDSRELAPGIVGTLLLLALIAIDDEPARKRLRALAKFDLPDALHWGSESAALLKRFIQTRESGGSSQALFEFTRFGRPADVLTELLLMAWSDCRLTASTEARAKLALAACEMAQWHWLAAQIRACLQVLRADRPAQGPPALVHLRESQSPWDETWRALSELAALPIESTKRKTANSQLRVDLVDLYGVVTLGLLEQRPQKDGTFGEGTRLKSSKGMVDCRQRLGEGTPDARVLDACMAIAAYPRDLSTAYGNAGVLEALIGHPRVYWQRRSARPALISVEEGKFDIRLNELATGEHQLTISPEPPSVDSKRFVLREGERLRVYSLSNAHRRLLASVGSGIIVPRTALAPITALAPKLARFAALSSDLKSGLRAPQIGSSRLHILLEPRGSSLSARVEVRPFGLDVGPYFAAGEEPSEVLGAINGEVVSAKRDLAQERAELAVLIHQQPLLGADGRADFDDPEQALELIEALQGSRDRFTVAWPQGQARRVVSAKGIAVAITQKRDWLDVAATVNIDDERTLNLGRMLELMERSKGGYVRLDDNEYLRLSDQLKAQLLALKAFADSRGKVEVSRFAAPLLAGALGAAFDTPAIQSLTQKMDEAQQLKVSLPRTFSAELRDYQHVGFQWLMRCAHWGAGACLADDMGLGKTVQALAALTARAPLGAQLVVAPTSLIGNWTREANRFAPTLNVIRFEPTTREGMLKSLKSFDLLLISYGLLTQHIQAFEKITLATVVLDEAQAIKNAATQRAQAVFALNAQWRVATTGTPIENHLGELWSLFNFLNPGLLGSQPRFTKRFQNPIERDPSGPEKALLRRLIAPFLLRRTKAEVLAELPPRTEITLLVTPSAGEIALAGALKLKALNLIAATDGSVQSKQIRILAEIMRLRRAACHPSLVAPDLNLGSAKLERLIVLVEELKDNRHRALIFSQFVDYLTIVRERLDAASVSYQYLDGSTPGKERDRAVSAFQNGESDVFLLSLKAGGVGLNLTAADYVIHLDPWWNPAVEQQASDRAHRIGQTRPVTIYRLVLEGSIEEKILSLHGAKRELMDSVLADTDSPAKVGAEELLALIQSV